jgi:anaerobic selenocysteine-containing dehydrogenase
MLSEYLHQRKDFADLLRILEVETGIQAELIEKDYWIMHVLHGLKQQGFDFELKGGTSLSKGYKIINRFSEDIDIHIKPPDHLGVNENPKNTKEKSTNSRKYFYDWLAQNIKIEGITSIERDYAFDDSEHYRSGGIRLYYDTKTIHNVGVKEGILLEAGFDTVTPNRKLNISSWAYDRASSNPKIKIIDNKAIDIVCYHPGYTFVEKLQTIATKYRQERDGANIKSNLMRQYYDLYCLLENPEVLTFLGTAEYFEHKKKRFPSQDLKTPIAENQAFLLFDSRLREEFKSRYQSTSALYYRGQPPFEEILERISQYLGIL